MSVIGFRPLVRFFSVSRAAIYASHGSPVEVIKVKEHSLPVIKSNCARIRMLAAPLNPSDFNMIEGVYHILPPMPAVGGNEGVGIIEEIGTGVDCLQVGDWVIPKEPGFGTWRSHAVCPVNQLQKIANDIPRSEAATLAVNPPTAFRMLKDFVKLSPGDVVIQNGAMSAVGQAVIQLAKNLFNVKTINIIRDRPNFDDDKNFLYSIGADVVVKEGSVGSTAYKEFLRMRGINSSNNIRLGFNCVGGRSLVGLCKGVSNGAKIVTYGGMSKRPVTVGTGSLIFKDISLYGFWLSRWNEQHSQHERMDMIKQIIELIRIGKFKTRTKEFNFIEEGHPGKNQYGIHSAIDHANASFTNSKALLVM